MDLIVFLLVEKLVNQLTESEEVRAAMDKYTRERNAVKCLLVFCNSSH